MKTIKIKPGDLAVLRDLVNSIKVKITAIEEYLDRRVEELKGGRSENW